jgi:MraZ protein
VAKILFQGASALTLDSKGRFALPTRHREALGATSDGLALVLTKHPDGALMIFPRMAWERFSERLAALPMSAQGWKRVFLGHASEVEPDASLRVLVPPELRQFAGLVRDVTLLGMGSHFELWDTARYAAQELEVMRSPMPEALMAMGTD